MDTLPEAKAATVGLNIRVLATINTLKPELDLANDLGAFLVKLNRMIEAPDSASAIRYNTAIIRCLRAAMAELREADTHLESLTTLLEGI